MLSVVRGLARRQTSDSKKFECSFFKPSSICTSSKQNQFLKYNYCKIVKNTIVKDSKKQVIFGRFYSKRSSSPEDSSEYLNAQYTESTNESKTNDQNEANNKEEMTSTEIPREEQPFDPYRIHLGSWYSPELKRRATLQLIAERDAAIPKRNPSTPISPPWPSNDAETKLLQSMKELISSQTPKDLADNITPYLTNIKVYKEVLTDIHPISPEQIAKQLPDLPDLFSTHLSLPTSSTRYHITSNTSAQSSITSKEASDQTEALENKIDSNEVAEPSKQDMIDLITFFHLQFFPHLLEGSETVPETVKEAFDTNLKKVMTLDRLSDLVDESNRTLQAVLPALVEADLYYAAETLNHVLRESGPVDLAQTINANLSPRQITALLPAMCRVNSQWREDGFFDLVVKVLSSDGILRWEPVDVAKVIADLPKVTIASEYYTSPEFDPNHPDNIEKSHQQILKDAQKSLPNGVRWDHQSYGKPGDFLLQPSRDDVEAAKREYEQSTSQDLEDATLELDEQISDSKLEENPVISNTSKSSEDPEDDLIDYLTIAADPIPAPAPAVVFEPSFYNPIAWQPEELGRLVGTMLSQELELDDIVSVISHLATEGWKEEAGRNPWYSYMGYLSTILSDSLAANKHWVDEDFSWVIHDVVARVGPWALRNWNDYRSDEHRMWLADIIVLTAIKYDRFKHDYRLIMILLNMLCDNWPESEHQMLSDLIEARMRDRTYAGRIDNWMKYRITKQLKQPVTSQQLAQSKLWIAPYNVGPSPKMPDLVEPKELKVDLLDKLKHQLYQSEEEKYTAPSRIGSKPNNTIQW